MPPSKLRMSSLYNHLRRGLYLEWLAIMCLQCLIKPAWLYQISIGICRTLTSTVSWNQRGVLRTRHHLFPMVSYGMYLFHNQSYHRHSQQPHGHSHDDPEGALEFRDRPHSCSISFDRTQRCCRSRTISRHLYIRTHFLLNTISTIWSH